MERLKNAYADMNPDSQIARSMRAAVTQNEAVLNAWVDAVSEGVENFNLQDGQKNDAQEGVRYSPRMAVDMTEQERYEKLKDLNLSISASVNHDAISNAEEKYGTDIRDGTRLKPNDRKRLFKKIVDGITRSVNKVSRNEYTGSKYSEKISVQ